MKKQIKKLSLNKKTISNLTLAEMNRQVGGGSYSYFGPCGCHTKGCTKNANTCPGHNTCQYYTCV
jgi:hypothetical protein